MADEKTPVSFAEQNAKWLADPFRADRDRAELQHDKLERDWGGLMRGDATMLLVLAELASQNHKRLAKIEAALYELMRGKQ